MLDLRIHRAVCAMLQHMTKPLYILYIPGVGDDNTASQRLLISTWWLWGASAELFPMRWSNSEPWSAKQNRLLARITQLCAEHHDVAIIGSSAGAAAAVWAFAQLPQKLVGCVLIAGKTRRADTIGQPYAAKSPALVDAVRDAEWAIAQLSSKDKTRIQSRYAIADGVVLHADSVVPGAHNHTALSIGHAWTIATQLVAGAPFYIHFLRKMARIPQ